MENLIMHGRVAAQIGEFSAMNASAVETIAEVLERGRRLGIFQEGPSGPSALDVHQVLSALVLNRIEHQWTFSLAFGRDMLGDDCAHVRSLIEETVMRLVSGSPSEEIGSSRSARSAA